MPTVRTWVLLKTVLRIFERSACFYVIIIGNFERFHYFYFETNFLDNEKLFQKTEIPFFS